MSSLSPSIAPNNPKGIGASSPRLACNAYLGCAFGNRINANGVVAEVRRARAGTDGLQPRCGWGCFSDDDPGWLVPRNPGLWDGIPLGFSNGARLCCEATVEIEEDRFGYWPLALDFEKLTPAGA